MRESSANKSNNENDMHNKIPSKLATALLSGCLAIAASQTATADQTSHVYGIHDRDSSYFAFTHATLFSEPGQSIKNATLVIQDGVIVSVEKGGKVPKGATEIDINAHFVYAGFIDPYSDYTFKAEKKSPQPSNQAPKYLGERKGGNSWNNAIHAEINWVDDFKADPDAAKAYLKNGFTTVQSAKLDGIFQGQAVTVSLAKGIANDLIYNAHASHFGSFDKGTSKQEYPSSLMGSIALIRQSLSDAKWYQTAKGKIDSLNTGQRVEYNASLDGLTEIKNSQMIFNADDYLSTLRADRLFDSYDLSVSYIADGHEYNRIDEIKKTDAEFILPLKFPAKPDVSSYESQLDVSLAELRHWERAPANAAVLERNNIDFAFTQQGLKKPELFWKNIKTTISNGLSEKTALAALTTIPAIMAGVSNNQGRLKAGMLANFVIADGNLFKKGKINSVWIDGKENQLTAINNLDFNGIYSLSVSEKKLLLKLKQQGNKVSGTVSVNDKDTAIKVTLQNKNKLEFNANLSSIGLNGVYRFSSRLNDNLLSGFYINDSNKQVLFSIQKTFLEKDDAMKKNKDGKEAATSYLSKITFPNRAFGVTKLATSQNIHIKNATLWTSEKDGILTETDLLIKNGKISKIGKNLKKPRGYQTIDATGKHVTAGIIDEHSHIAISKGVNEGSDAITAEVRIGDVLNPDDINIYYALAGGTTTAQLLHGSANPIGGQAQVIKLKWGASAEQLKEKRAPGSIKFALGENVKQSNWGDAYTIRYPQTRMGVETIVKDGFIRAQDYIKSWKDYKKLSSSQKKAIAPPRKDFRLETLSEIINGKRFVHSHSYVASEILSLMNIAEEFGFTIQTFTHILEGYKVADEMVKHGASASTFADWWAYKFEVLDAIPMNTCLMMDRGVNVSINSDSGDLIRRLNTEAAKSVQYCGMSQQDAIKMVTINPAKQLRIDHYTGSLKEGKDADFVIWSGNPLSIYSKVEQTWIAGTKYFDREQDLKYREAIATEKNALIQKLLRQGSDKKKDDKKDTDNKQAAQLQQGYWQKQEAQWQCDDNFDFWQWNSAQKGAQL